MISIAITGASGLVGAALLGVLGDAPEVERLVAIDVREPARWARGLEFHRADIAHSELKPLLEGCDVLVHLASVVDPVPDEALMARVVMPRRPTSLGTHSLCQRRSTFSGSSPMSRGLKYSMAALAMPPTSPRPMPVTPASVSICTRQINSSLAEAKYSLNSRPKSAGRV